MENLGKCEKHGGINFINCPVCVFENSSISQFYFEESLSNLVLDLYDKIQKDIEKKLKERIKERVGIDINDENMINYVDCLRSFSKIIFNKEVVSYYWVGEQNILLLTTSKDLGTEPELKGLTFSYNTGISYE